MIIATLNTHSGLSVNIEIPESAKEIPFSKYVSANIEYVSICEAFIAELTGYPDVPHDESIDCITMALNYYLVNASRGQRKMEIY